jgi:Ca-activated chloride channel family protein
MMDGTLILNQNNSSILSIDTLLSHDVLQVSQGQQACYVMLDISPDKTLPTTRLPINLSLIIDKSTSMQGVRLQQVKEATRQIIDNLEVDDVFSLIAFSDRAEVLIPAHKNIDQARAKSITSTIQASGGTEMFQGLYAGLQEVQRNRSDRTVNHIILLTDGQTYGDETECLHHAEWAGHNQISLSTMGIGTDWNEDLLDAMAAASTGTSIYIDAPRKIVETFQATIRDLSTIVARELSLNIKMGKQITLHESYQINPHIRRLTIENQKTSLGPLGKTNSKTIILEFHMHNTSSPGELELAKLIFDGDVPNLPGRQAVAEALINVEITADTTIAQKVPTKIVTALGKLAIYRMHEKAMDDIEQGNLIAATKRLETMATRLLNLGETELAREAFLEAGRLSRTGQLSSEGKKKIRYGTRSLSTMPKELQND